MGKLSGKLLAIIGTSIKRDLKRKTSERGDQSVASLILLLRSAFQLCFANLVVIYYVFFKAQLVPLYI